ncbi:MAG: hypothetical protein M3345_04165 [Actinomycetota bacterium]|nr:hypothetical protein [Actinomycetota bacterium]
MSIRKSPALLVTNLVLLGAVIVHGADHAFRHISPTPAQLGVLGIIGLVLTTTSTGLAWIRHASAPRVGAFVGSFTAVSAAAVHLAPRWGFFSQPYSSIPVDTVSWAILTFEIAAAVVLAVVSLSVVTPARRARAA